MRNGTMIQYFHWYYPNDGSLWKKVQDEAAELARLGVNAVWLPPAFKGTRGAYSEGYDVYDIYDLGEFNQKGSVRTKYGTRREYLQAIDALHTNNIQVYADIVVNHLGGGDEIERIKVVEMDFENRNEVISDTFEIDAFTKFTYPGRKGKYSTFQWDHTCFSGVDYDHSTGRTGIFNILNDFGLEWEEMISDEKGNYDYLMYCDLEFRNPAVREELKKWGKWFVETTGVDGFRLDAVKHIAPQFYNEWLQYMREITGKELFAVGEYWAPGDQPMLQRYIDATDSKVTVFDSALHHSLHHASQAGSSFNLSTILDGSLVSTNPSLAVTVVANHDTQPLQSLEAPVSPWFKPLAYALILLRQEGYPCVFFPDLYGASYTDKGRDGNEYEIIMPRIDCLPELMVLRTTVAYGVQHSYFDFPNCVGWTREGDLEMDGSGCAVVMSNGGDGFKKMYIGEGHAGKTFRDALGKVKEEVPIDKTGHGEFKCNAASVSVWVGTDYQLASRHNTFF